MRRRHHRLERAEQAVLGRHPLREDRLRRHRRHPRALIERRRVGELVDRQIGFDHALVLDDHAAGIGRAPDDREIEAPLAEHLLAGAFRARLEDHQHPLLAFREHHLVGRHVGLALRHVVEVQLDADAALVGHLRRRGCEARRAHVLDRDDRIGRHQLEARLDQQLLGEGVADLHGRALFRALVVELGRRHGRAVDAVAPGLGADVDHRQADALGGGIENLVRAREADAHRVDEDVAVVAGVEVGLAADRRHADAIAVAADAGDDARHEVARLGVRGIAEAQRVEVRHGPRAHREHVAHDAADARRRALVGLDEARVVVALHLEDGAVAVAEIDDAGVLARPLDHLRAGGRQLLQPEAARFVGAVLRPHHREDAEFQERRLATDDAEQAVVLVALETVGGDHLGRDLDSVRGVGAAHGGSGLLRPFGAL